MSFTKDKSTDNYMTNKTEWERIKEYIPNNKKIWSPFFGDGKQKEYFKDMGYDIIHDDEDFFENNKGDIIIDNIPFSKKKDIFKRLKELDKPFILICPSYLLSLKFSFKNFNIDPTPQPKSRILFGIEVSSLFAIFAFPE